MSTTGFEDGPPVATGAQIGDSGNAVHLFGAICAALYQRTHTGRGQRVQISMRAGILNLCRVKLRDQQRLEHGPLAEYPNKEFGDFVPRSGNASGGGQPGWAVRCKPTTEKGANAWLYVVIQPQVWEPLMNKIGRPELVEQPRLRHARGAPAAPAGDLRRDRGVDDDQRTKWEAFEELNSINVPVRAGAQHQGPDRGRGPARRGNDRRRRASRARHLLDGRRARSRCRTRRSRSSARRCSASTAPRSCRSCSTSTRTSSSG